MQGVSVLIELGADVNAGEEIEVPLCLAVQSGNKDMVEQLLNKGATNIQRALNLARDKRLDEITGLLLAHIALEKSNDVVNLSGLELDRIKPTWILPSLGIYYSPPKRRLSGHRRNRSLGQMKELILMRRKSVDMLQLSSSGVAVGGLNSGGGMENFSRVDSDTGGMSSGVEEPESGIHMGLHMPRTGIGSGNAITPPSQKPSKLQLMMRRHSAMDILPSKVRSPTTEKRGISVIQSSSIQPKHPLEMSDIQVCTSDNTSSQDETDGETQNQPQVKLEILEPQTPPSELPPPSLRARKSGALAPFTLSAFEPTLSPIHGTPNHSLHRHDIILTSSVNESDSGVGNGPVSPVDPNKQLLQQSQSNDSLSSAVTVENNNRLALSSTPRSQRYRERKGTVTGARELPFSNANEYLNKHKVQSVDSPASKPPSSPASPSVEGQKTRKEFSMSPSQILKRFRKHRHKHHRRKVSNSVFYTPRSMSPIAIVYTGGDYDGGSASDSNEYSYSKLSNRETKSADESGPEDTLTCISPRSQSSSSNKVVGDGESLSAKLQKLRKHHQWRQSREHTPSSSSSSVMTTPSVSVSTSRRTSLETSVFSPLNYRQSRDEVDFGAYEAIPEESVASEVSVMSTKLVKIVDLSSNILTTLVDLADAPGHEFVVQQMAEVRKLDLKQNQLKGLPPGLMKVS